MSENEAVPLLADLREGIQAYVSTGAVTLGVSCQSDVDESAIIDREAPPRDPTPTPPLSLAGVVT